MPEAISCYCATQSWGHSSSPYRTAERLGVAALADPEICWELTAVFAEDEAGRPASAATRLFLGLLRSAAPVLEEIAGGA